MNQKTLIGLAIAALIAIVVAVVIHRSSAPQSETGAGEETAYLVPGLRDHVNDVNKIVVTGPGDATVATIARGDKDWTVAEKNAYPADTGKLREVLLKLGDAKLLEEKTSSKDKYDILGVRDLADKDAKGIGIEIDGLARPVKLIVGNSNPHGGGTFVRRAGEAKSWLASGTFLIDKKTADWLQKDVADVPARRIESVKITHPDGKTLEVSKDAEGDQNFKLADVPKGREPGSEYTINSVASTLASLRFDDVVPAKDAMPPEKTLDAHFVAFDGLVVDLKTWQTDGKDYARLHASVDEDKAAAHVESEQAKAKAAYEAEVAAAAKKPDGKDKDGDATMPPAPAKPPAVADPGKDRSDRLASVHKEAADLDARFKDWTYVLPAYKYASIDKTTDDLLKPLESKKDARAEKTTKPAKKKR